MHRKQPNELVHPLVHGPVELGEPLKMLTDDRLLLRSLLEQSLGNDMLDIAARDGHLLVPIFYAAHGIGHGAPTDRLALERALA